MAKLGRAIVPMFVVLVSMGVWGLSGVSGADRQSPVGGDAARRDVSFVAKNQSLVKTFLVRGGDTVTVPASTFTQVGPNAKVKCPGNQGKCIVTADVHVQLSAADQTNIELCPFLDGSGSAAQTECALNVGTTSGTAYASHSYVHTFKVSPGMHTFAMKVLTTTAANAFGYSYVYNVYRNK